jgi:hypothetical protein
VSHKVSDEVWAHASTRVRTTPLIVLLRMADAANDGRMMWESMPTIAKRTGLTDRAVRKAVRELEDLRIVEAIPKDEAPAEASKYRSYVRRIRPVDDWLFGDLEDDNPEPGSALNPEPGSVTGGNPEPGSPNPYYLTRSNKETVETTSLQGAHRAPNDEPDADNTRPGRKGWDAVQPLRGPGGRRKSRKQEAEEAALAEKELDPAYVVAQALATGYPGDIPYADLPASEPDLAPPVRRGRKPRSKRPSERLTDFFEREALRVGTAVPGATNKAALGRNLQRWMDEGAEYNTISRMITEYWSESWQRSEADPAWKDFQNQRGLLTQRLGKQTQAAQSEIDRHDENAW